MRAVLLTTVTAAALASLSFQLVPDDGVRAGSHEDRRRSCHEICFWLCYSYGRIARLAYWLISGQ
jgi:hypothetical protein